MDEIQKFELDAGLATKYSLLEKDERLDHVEAIQHSIKNVVQVQYPKKLPKDRKRERLTLSPEEVLANEAPAQLPKLSTVRSQLMSTGTVVLEKA